MIKRKEGFPPPPPTPPFICVKYACAVSILYWLDLDEAMRKIGVRITFLEFFTLRGELYKLKNRIEMQGKLSRRLITVFKTKAKGSKVLSLD